MKRGPGRPRKYFTEAERLAADVERKRRYRAAHPRGRGGKRGRPRKHRTAEELAAARRAARRRHYLKVKPNARQWPLVDERARAWELRAAGYTQAEIATRVGASEAAVRGWLRKTGVAWKLRPEDREPIAAALRGGVSPEILAARYGYAERSIQEWIREGRLPAKGLVANQCRACGAEYQTATRQAGACSDRCRRALANACRIASRWRAHGRLVSPAARELMIAQSFLRLETTQQIGG